MDEDTGQVQFGSQRNIWHFQFSCIIFHIKLSTEYLLIRTPSKTSKLRIYLDILQKITNKYVHADEMLSW